MMQSWSQQFAAIEDVIENYADAIETHIWDPVDDAGNPDMAQAQREVAAARAAVADLKNLLGIQ